MAAESLKGGKPSSLLHCRVSCSGFWETEHTIWSLKFQVTFTVYWGLISLQSMCLAKYRLCKSCDSSPGVGAATAAALTVAAALAGPAAPGAGPKEKKNISTSPTACTPTAVVTVLKLLWLLGLSPIIFLALHMKHDLTPSFCDVQLKLMHPLYLEK